VVGWKVVAFAGARICQYVYGGVYFAIITLEIDIDECHWLSSCTVKYVNTQVRKINILVSLRIYVSSMCLIATAVTGNGYIPPMQHVLCQCATAVYMMYASLDDPQHK
jgi:hypothetical protein